MSIQEGKFIVIDGLDGAGKTTLVNALVSMLNRLGIPAIATQGLGATPVGKHLRQFLLSPDGGKLSRETQILMLMGVVRDMVDNFVLPAIANGTWVICDRYSMSTYAYQYDAEQRDMLIQLGTHGYIPDITFFMDVDYETSQQRIRLLRGGTPNHFDTECRLEFAERQTRMRRYIERHSHETIVTLDATHPIDESLTIVKRTIDDVLKPCYPKIV